MAEEQKSLVEENVSEEMAWVVASMVFVLPILILLASYALNNAGAGYCNQVLLRNHYNFLSDCIKANPGLPIAQCQIYDGPLAGKIVGPLYKNPNCGNASEPDRLRYNLPKMLPYRAVAVEPMRKCGRGRFGYYRCSAYTRLGERYPDETQLNETPSHQGNVR